MQYRTRPVQYRTHARTAAGRVRATVTVDDSCELDDSAVLCTYDPLAIDARFADRQWEVFGRIGGVGLAALRVWRAGNDDGATLRAELSKLGPVFCKVGQTMATRPDIVGLETSRSLGQLQDAMEPEADPATAMATLRSALGGEAMLAARLRNISAAPVAATPDLDPDHYTPKPKPKPRPDLNPNPEPQPQPQPQRSPGGGGLAGRGVPRQPAGRHAGGGQGAAAGARAQGGA